MSLLDTPPTLFHKSEEYTAHDDPLRYVCILFMQTLLCAIVAARGYTEAHSQQSFLFSRHACFVFTLNVAEAHFVCNCASSNLEICVTILHPYMHACWSFIPPRWCEVLFICPVTLRLVPSVIVPTCAVFPALVVVFVATIRSVLKSAWSIGQCFGLKVTQSLWMNTASVDFENSAQEFY